MGMCCSLHLTPNPVARAQRTRHHANADKQTPVAKAHPHRPGATEVGAKEPTHRGTVSV